MCREDYLFMFHLRGEVNSIFSACAYLFDFFKATYFEIVLLMERLEMTLLLMSSLGWQLKQQFSVFNRNLYRQQTVDALTASLKLYQRLCRSVQLFGELFGAIIAVTCVGCIPHFVNTAAYMLFYVSSRNDYESIVLLLITFPVSIHSGCIRNYKEQNYLR